MELARLWRVLAIYEAELAPKNYVHSISNHPSSHPHQSPRSPQAHIEPAGHENEERGGTRTRTLLSIVQIIRPVPKRAKVLRQARAGAKLPVEDVALVHEEDELDLGEELVRADGFPEQDRVFL